ncbi:alcohol dehydrogenase Bli-4 [Fusarium albosuccineum]|uniref:Alcohol dehydrogenase Bli-4 n=1 Tax=Fusarium albosuccineum TaxID=1237068 RepID=A0A8H4L3M6_9HYPO|nr:alcohol dehydrogenase Bli-4 [Fusarium albosuccineum]
MFNNKDPFNPERDIPSLKGKVIFITGGNTGIGKQSAIELCKHQPAEIWIGARNAKTADAAIAEIKGLAPEVSVQFVQLDLKSFESVRAAARTVLASTSRLDILMLNAGIMACSPGLTKEGYEVQFGTNHMGHALLVKLLLQLLLNTAALPNSDVRVVSVSSVAHKFGVPGGIDFDHLKTADESMTTNDRYRLYGQSKLANILYTRELARRYPQLTSVAIHPGTVKTGLMKDGDGSLLITAFRRFVVPMISVEVDEGAKSQLWAATSKTVENGEYYVPVGVPGKGSAQSADKELSGKLWDWTQKELET